MPRYIIKIHDDKFNRDYYLEWSTVVDAPVSYGFSLDHFTEYYLQKYGQKESPDLSNRMIRVEKNGISAYDENLDDLFEWNRAGDKETTLDKEGILNKYCRNIES